MKHPNPAALLAHAELLAQAPIPNLSEYSKEELLFGLRRLDALFHKLGEYCDAVEAQTGTPCFKASEYQVEIAERCFCIEEELMTR